MLRSTSEAVVTCDGDRILTDCFQSAFVTTESADGIVIGLRAPQGPTAMHDFDIGKVQLALQEALQTHFVNRSSLLSLLKIAHIHLTDVLCHTAALLPLCELST